MGRGGRQQGSKCVAFGGLLLVLPELLLSVCMCGEVGGGREDCQLFADWRQVKGKAGSREAASRSCRKLPHVPAAS